VNNQRVGESHDWQSQALLDIKKALHAGDNVVAVGVKNDQGEGGLDPDVNIEIVGQPVSSPWARSLFNGLAQVIVQSGKTAGEITLVASAEKLSSATNIVKTVVGPERPSVP
jgi:beta-galactosidase